MNDIEEKKPEEVESEVVNNYGRPTRSIKWMKVAECCAISLYFAAIIAFFVLGFAGNYWYNAWILFFVPDVFTSIFRCIYKRTFQGFSIVFLTLAIYFFLNLVYPGKDENLWGNLWYVFLLIPIYYLAAMTIDQYIDRTRHQ